MLGFYQIDTESDSYFVGRVERKPEQLAQHLRELPIGKTWWNPVYPTRGFERYK